MNLRILLQSIIIFSLLLVGSHTASAQCGTSAIYIMNTDTVGGTLNPVDTVDVFSAGVNPCGVTPCAEVCPNDLTTYILSVEDSVPNSTYTWALGSGAILQPGSNINDPAIAVALTNSSAIQVSISNGGCDTTIVVELITSLQAPQINVTDAFGSSSQDLSACVGDDISLYANCSAACGGLVYSWENLSTGLIVSTADSLVFTVNDTTIFDLVVIDTNQCVTQTEVPVTVRVAPDINAILGVNVLPVLCPDQTQSISAGSAISNLSTISNNGGVLTYQWSLVDSITGNIVQTTTNNSVVWQPNTAAIPGGAYYAALTAIADYGNGNVCIDSSGVSDTFQVQPAIIAEILANGIPGNLTSSSPYGGLCKNAPLILQSSPANSNYTYNWTETRPSSAIFTVGTANSETLNASGLRWLISGPGIYTYSLTVTDGAGCNITDNIQVEILEIPEFTLPDATYNASTDVWETTTCDDEDILFNAVNTGTILITDYDWDVFDDATGNPWSPPVNTCLQTCSICGPFGGPCFTFCCQFGPVYSPPVHNVYCSNLVDCSEFETVNWTDNGNIFVTAEGSNGCSVTEEIEVTVATTAPSPITINATTFCSGENASVSLPPGPTDIAWIVNGDTMAQGNSQSFPLINTASTSQTVTVEAHYEDGGCFLVSTQNVTINPSVIVQLPELFDRCTNTQIDIEPFVVGGGTPFTYTWNTGALSGSGTSVWSTGPTPTTAANTYTINVQVENAFGCTDSDVKNLTLRADCGGGPSGPGRPQLDANSEVICEGDVLVLTVNNYTPPNIPGSQQCSGSSCEQWDVTDGTNTNDNQTPCSYNRTVVYSWSTGTTSSSNTINIPIGANTPSPFTVQVQMGYKDDKRRDTDDDSPIDCENYSDPALYEFFLTKTFTIIRPEVVLRDSIKTCVGQEINLDASCNGCYNQATYIWSRSGGNIVGSVTNSTVSPYTDTVLTNPGSVGAMYNVTVVDGNNCSAVDSIPVSIRTAPGLYVTTVGGPAVSQGLANYCPTSSVGLLAGTNSSSCTNCTYSWNTGQAGQSITVNQPGTYIVEVQEDDCVETASIEVAPYPQPNPDIINSDSILLSSLSNPNLFLCGVADTIGIDPASCPGCAFTWNTGATTPYLFVNSQGGYYVEALDTNGCVGFSDPILAIESLDGLNSVATADPTAICNSHPTVLDVTACVDCNYTWFNTGNLGVPISFDRITSTTTVGNYYAQVTNSDGCTYNSNIVNVSSTTITPPSISSNTNILCTGSTATLEVSTLPGYQAYQWYNNGNVISGATDSVYSTTFIGNYYCEVTFANGCVEQSNIITISNGTFNPEATATNSVVCQGEVVEISTPSYAGWTYQWYKDGILMVGETGAILDATLAGNYYCEVTNDDLCTNLTNIITLGTSTINSISASTLTPTICPGDTAILSVSLCANCSYQWYDAISGNPLNGISSPSNFNFQAGNSGQFYARVNNGFCFTNSDTVDISLLPTPPATINSLDTIVCDGVLPTLFTTQACTGCNYTWLKDGSPIFGALNDSVYQVPSAADTGDYQILITYSNGCSDTSDVRRVADGTFDVIISIDSLAGDTSVTDGSLVCNGSDVVLQLDAGLSDPIDCNAPGCSYRWVRNIIPITGAVNPTHTTNTGGIFVLEVTDRRGCVEESNSIQIFEVNHSPTLSANPTILCDTQRVDLQVSSCVNCTYDWFWGGNPIPNTATNVNYNADSTILNTDSATIYFVDVTKEGCTARTPLVSVNQATTPGVTIGATDLNVCAGDTVTLYRQGGPCASCTFQWLLNDVPVTAATTPLLTTDSAGIYTLEMTIVGSNCKDTSAAIVLADIPPPSGFDLDLTAAGLTPLPATPGAQVNLFDAVSPTYLQNSPYSTSADSAFFYSQPFNAALPPNSGLSTAPINNIFDPYDPVLSLSGFHRIFYQRDTAGCTFITSDIMYVLDEPNIQIANENISAPLYEACVSDTLVLNVGSLPFKIDSVYLLDANNNYQLVDIATDSLYSTNYAGTTVWDGFIRVGIPAWAQESFMLVTSVANADTFITPFILIHNENLNIGGLPTTVCSNGDSIALTGTPLGGFFTAEYMGAAGGSNNAAGSQVPNAFDGINFIPAAMIDTSYGADQIQNVNVVYNYINTYTNGSTCPLTDTVIQMVEARAVFLDSVSYNPIAVSQEDEEILNLIYTVFPYSAQPSQWAAVGNTGFFGNFTFPAGAPIDFLPATAGVGMHAMTYTIENGICSNSFTDSIEVIDAPNPINIPDSICRNQVFAPFAQQLGGIYDPDVNLAVGIQPGITIADTSNTFVVTTASGTGLTFIPGVPERYSYDPSVVPSNTDTLFVEYWYKKVEYDISAGAPGTPIDTIEYVIGSITIPIFIDTVSSVEIIDTLVDSVYCEVNELFLLAGSPSGGFFTLNGGTGPYQGGDTLDFNILNPFAVHNNESSNTDYLLTYVKQGAVCVNTDTMTITIPEPLDPTFAPASGSTFYCASDPIDSMIINTIGGFTSDWLINGVTIDTFPETFHFNPQVLVPGNQAVAHVVQDTLFGCVYTEIDTFVVNPLPIPQVIPELDTSYCTNDPIDTVSVTPYPICALNAPNGLTILSQNFDSTSIAAPSFPPAGWVEYNNGTGEPWMLTSNAFSFPFAAMVNQSNDVEDAWLFSPMAPFITGHSYQITVMARANCNNPVGGCDPAQLRITLANAQNFASHVSPSATIIVDTNFTSSAYLLYTFNYVHNGITGNYSVGLQNYTTNNGRSLFIDDFKVDDLSINGCVQGGVGSMNGPGISYLADSSYTFDPTIVSPGSYVITYTYTDAATGCSDNVDMNVNVKAHPNPVFNNLANQYCDNAPVVPLNGVPSGGTFSSTGPNLVTSPTNVYDPNTGITDEIITYSYTAPNGCSDVFRDTVDVVTIQDSMYISNVDPAGYCANADSIIIEVEPYLGPLAGPGGNPWGQNAGDGYFQPQDGLNPDSAYIGNAIFYPDSAVLESGRHGDFVLTYIYTSSGCVDTTRATFTVHALPQLSFDQAVPDSISLPDSICYNAPARQIRVNNHIITGNMGQIEYDSLIGIGPVVGGTFTLTDTAGNTIPNGGGFDYLNDILSPPNFANPGWYNVSYYYEDVNGCTATINDSFRIDTIPEIYFTGLQPDRVYCENEPPSLVLAYPPYFPGSGFMQIINGTDTVTIDSSFYMIDPAALVDLAIPTGNVYDIYYEFEDLNFCRANGSDSFEVRPYPRLSLTGLPATFCSAPDTLNLQQFVNPQGGIFTDDLATTGIVGDTGLALNGPSGPREITYFYLDTITTCWSDTSKMVTIYNTPAVDFYALGGCENATITFVADTNVTNLIPGVDSITSIEWIFGDGNFANVTPTQPTLIPDQTHIYGAEGVYEVMLAVNNQNGCEDTVSNFLTISPHVTNYPYVQTFDNGPSGWYQEEDVVVPDSVAIWQWAELTGAEINDPGNYAWVTKAEAPYTYEQNERAWVYSPCFDMTNSWRPMIVLDVWRDFLTDIDGTIMEYYDYNSNSWQRLGEKDKGINWYQTNFLVSRPGNQDVIQYPQGWTGQSNGWEKARYRLDHLRGNNFVRFRIAFASDPNTVLEGNEGMAFDSVWVGERGRNVLVEHFSNFYHQSTVTPWNMGQINQNLYDTIFNVTNGRDVSLIQYATPQLGTGTQDDPLVTNNQVDFADVFARVGYYGINENSKMRIDGTTRGTGNSEEISQWELDYDMLQFPAFDITIDQFAFAGNTIQVNTTTTALMNMDSADYAFYVAITEDDVQNFSNTEMALLRKFRPDAAGEPFNRPWVIGDAQTYTTSWVYPSNINGGSIPTSRMVCIAFIQNKTTKEVYQVATTRDLSIFASTDDIAEVQDDLDGLKLFPNPASSYFNVRFDNALSEDYDWKLIDVLGRVLEQGQARAGSTEMQVDTRRLSEGNYFFVLENDKVYTQRQVVIIKRP
jgi:hypothetical protein